MTVEDFLHILMSPDLGLQLEENEQTFIASQVHKTTVEPPIRDPLR